MLEYVIYLFFDEIFVHALIPCHDQYFYVYEEHHLKSKDNL